MWTSNAQNKEADIDRRPAEANPSIEPWHQRETELESGGSMRMMEPLVALWPWWGLIGFGSSVWKVGLLMLGTSVVTLLTFQTQDSSLILKQTRASLSVSDVLARLIKFYSFIFHSSAVSSSYSAIAPLDSVQLTAPREPKLRADLLLFWCTSPGQSCLNANTLGGVAVGLAQVVGEKCRPNLSLAQTRILFFSTQQQKSKREFLV